MLSALLTTLITITTFIISAYALNHHRRIYYKGVSCRFQGEYQTAIEYYTRALELKPKFAHAYYSRGNAQFELGNYLKALNDYSQAIEFESDFVEAYYNRGNTHAALGNWKEALADFTQTVRLDSEHAKGYGNRGFVYTKLNNPRDAERDFRQAINLFLRQGDLQNYQLVRQYMGDEKAPAELNQNSALEANSAPQLIEVGVV
ncbi:tetratricopeptide repeat protein [Myxosarcina sp. GI1(2024)]